jgi:hypothetical protein
MGGSGENSRFGRIGLVSADQPAVNQGSVIAGCDFRLARINVGERYDPPRTDCECANARLPCQAGTLE